MKNLILASVLLAALTGCSSNNTDSIITDAAQDTFTNPLLPRGADP